MEEALGQTASVPYKELYAGAQLEWPCELVTHIRV
jgi:hypothetical protein